MIYEEKQVDELPKNDDSYWLPSRPEKYELHKPVTCKKEDHFFKEVAAGDVRCTKCGLGYLLGDCEIIDGHIYLKGQILI